MIENINWWLHQTTVVQHTYSFIVSFEAVVYSISSQTSQAAFCKSHATQVFSLFEYSIDFLHRLSEGGFINLDKLGWGVEIEKSNFRSILSHSKWFIRGYLATEFSRKVCGESDGCSKAVVALDKDLFAGHLGYPLSTHSLNNI